MGNHECSLRKVGRPGTNYGEDGRTGEAEDGRAAGTSGEEEGTAAMAERTGVADHRATGVAVVGGESGRLECRLRARRRGSRRERVRPTPAGRPWAKQRVARFLDVSHTWVNKLVKRFERDPDRMRRRMAACAPASFEKLERAREETRRQRKFGWIRGPIRMRRVKWTLGGKAQRAVVWTHSEKRRREEALRLRSGQARGGQQGPPSVSYADLPAWARGAV